VGQTFYHKSCLEIIKKERAAKQERERLKKLQTNKKKCFGWGIASGIVSLVISLIIFLVNANTINPGIGVLFSLLSGYGMFALIYCILSGSYIGDVFIRCASFTVKFPGLIFTWSLDGFMWLIGMKILFAVLGFFAGIFIFLFAVILSSVLAIVSFPFILIHNTRHGYDETI
jgi:hypothetical protein